MSGALAVAATSIRRSVRDRRALFFTLALPVVIIIVVGVTVRGFDTLPIGVVGGSSSLAARELTAALERSPTLVVRPFATVDAASTAVRRSEVTAAVVVPPDLGARLSAGKAATIAILAERANSTQQAAALDIEAAVASFSGRVQAAQFASATVGRPFSSNFALATGLEASVPKVGARTVVADANQQTLPEGFSYSAPTMLVLFVFINALAGGAVMIGTRRLGMYSRILAAPVPAAAVVAGELLATFAVALAQALLIVLIGSVAFGVSWGDPLAAGVLLVLWALVGAGAGVVAGTVFRTPEQAGAIGSALGIALGMLGGCMWPLSIVTPTMRFVGHFTPQAWAVDTWTTLLSRHGTFLDVAPKLGVLAAFAVGLILLAASRFRRALR